MKKEVSKALTAFIIVGSLAAIGCKKSQPQEEAVQPPVQESTTPAEQAAEQPQTPPASQSTQK